MKKFFSLLAVLAVTVFMGSTVFAALPNPQKAYAEFGETSLDIDFQLYNYTTNTYTFGTGGNYPATGNAEKILFSVADVAIGTTTVSYSSGTVFAKVSSNLTTQRPNTTIYMFTRSTDTAAGDYQAVNPRTENSKTLYSGLVRTTNKTSYLDGDYAPIEMMFTRATDNVAYPTSMSIDANAGNEKYLKDRADSDFTAAYATIGISGSSGGIWLGQTQQGADYYSLDDDVIIFFGARFHNVYAGDIYGTNVINIVNSAE